MLTAALYMTDLRELCERLRELGRGKPTDDARREVAQGLQSKWEGVQAAAAYALADWGDRPSVDLLRTWLHETFHRSYGIRGVAVKALAPCVGEEDVQWVLDAYFSRPGVLGKHQLLWLVMALPAYRARDRLLAESRSPDRDNRHAAMKAICNLGFPDKIALVRRFLEDADSKIRAGARNILREIGGRGSDEHL